MNVNDVLHVPSREENKVYVMGEVRQVPESDAAEARRLYEPGAQRLADFERRGSIVVGDVHPEVAAVAGALTPVPGGVGPLTIAMLLKNTVAAAQARLAR